MTQKETKDINICFEKELYERFESFCKTHGTSMADTVDLAIRQYMDRINNPDNAYWIEHPHECGPNWEYPRFECSKCHELEDNDSDYCPNCGREMIHRK